MENMDLFLERYDRHIKLPGFGLQGQQALTDASILVVGAGGSGSAVLAYLCSMGVGNLGIVENKPISLSDLQRQVLLPASQIGKSKIEYLSQHLRGINPEVKLKLHDFFLNSVNVLPLVSEYDVIVDATNSPGSNYLINDACVIAGIPFVFGFVHQNEGSVAVFNYENSATYRCMLDAMNGTGWMQNAHQDGSLGVLSGVVGCYQAAEVIKLITKIGDLLTNKVLTVNIFKNFHSITPIPPIQSNLEIQSLQRDYPLHLESEHEQDRIKALAPHQLELKIRYKEPIQLIDIRENADWDTDHIKNSIHLPVGDLYNHLEKIHQDIAVVLIDHKGEQSKDLCFLLTQKHGFGNIYYLEGGMEAWVAES